LEDVISWAKDGKELDEAREQYMLLMSTNDNASDA
jgi:hypothetical protein